MLSSRPDARFHILGSYGSQKWCSRRGETFIFIFRAFLKRSWRAGWPTIAPRWPKINSKTFQDVPKRGPDGPRWPQATPRSGPRWLQNHPSKQAKPHKIKRPIGLLILGHFWRQQRRKKTPKTASRGPKMAPKGPADPKIGPKTCQDGKMAPSWSKIAPRRPTEGPRGFHGAPRGPKRGQDGLKMAPTGRQESPRGPQDDPRRAQDGREKAPRGSNMGRDGLR